MFLGLSGGGTQFAFLRHSDVSGAVGPEPLNSRIYALSSTQARLDSAVRRTDDALTKVDGKIDATSSALQVSQQAHHRGSYLRYIPPTF